MLTGVLCYWEYQKNEDKFTGKLWKMVDAFPIDDDGYPLTDTKFPSNSREVWVGFMNKIEDEEIEPIRGRAVTIWNYTSGVRLLAFNPPEKLPKWMNPFFSDILTKSEKWSEIIENGYALYLGTGEKAMEIVSNYKEQS